MNTESFPGNIDEILKMHGVSAGPYPSTSAVVHDIDTIVAICKKYSVHIFAHRDGSIVRRNENVINGIDCWSLAFATPHHDKLRTVDDNLTLYADEVIWIPKTLYHKAQELAIKDDSNALRRLSTNPITRAFVYIDVSDYSKETPARQLAIISSIAGLITERRLWEHLGIGRIAWQSYEACICIGDGYIFVLKEAPHAVLFAAYIAHIIEHRNANKLYKAGFHFRIGVHVGEVYCFWDPGRNDWNYIGKGINGGQRVLAAIGKDQDDVVFISEAVRESLLQPPYDSQEGFRQVKDALQNRGRRADKHNEMWRVYEVNHTMLASESYNKVRLI